MYFLFNLDYILNFDTVSPVHLFRKGSSGADAEPVPKLDPVLIVSTEEELAPSRKTGSRVAPTLHWSRTKNHLRQGLGAGLLQPTRPTKTL